MLPSMRPSAGLALLVLSAASFAVACGINDAGKAFPAATGSGSTSSSGGSGSTTSTTSGTGGAGQGGASQGGTGQGGTGQGGTGQGGMGQGGMGQGGQGGGATNPVCGNTIVETGEMCDDGNTTPGDGCGVTCLTEDPNQCDGAPIPIALNQTIDINDSTSGATNKVNSTSSGSNSTCVTGTWPGPDLIYAVMPQADGTLTVTSNPSYSGHLLHTRTACPGTGGDQLACDYSSSSTTNDVNTVTVVAGQTYYVIVDSYQNNAGNFQLTLTLAP